MGVILVILLLSLVTQFATLGVSFRLALAAKQRRSFHVLFAICVVLILRTLAALSLMAPPYLFAQYHLALLLSELFFFLASLLLLFYVLERDRDDAIIRQRQWAMEETSHALIQASTDSMFLLNPDGTILAANQVTAHRFRQPMDALLGKNIFDLMPEGVAGRRRPFFREAVRTGRPVRFRDERQGYFLDNQICPVLSEKHAVLQLAVYSRDVTEEHERTEALRESLAVKDALLHEVHHRAKNNLQVISSLLNLQAASVESPEAKGLFRATQQRVSSMALIHETLYRSENLANIDFSVYAENLLDQLVFSFPLSDRKVETLCEVEELRLSIDTALPCGLILNELITNALKHAFPPGCPADSAPCLRVEFRRVADSQDLLLCVQDNGQGIPEGLDIEHLDSLGMQLIQTLVGQLDGHLRIERNQGTEIQITFREPHYKERM